MILLSDTGLRVSELRALRNEDIREDRLQFFGKGNKERIVPLSPFLLKMIKKFQLVKYDYFRNLRDRNGIRIVEDFLFVTKSGSRMKNNVMIELIVKEAAKASNVELDTTKSCYALRHYYVQSLLKNGTNLFTIRRLLGHSSIKTTQVYLNSITDDTFIESVADNTPLMNLLRQGRL